MLARNVQSAFDILLGELNRSDNDAIAQIIGQIFSLSQKETFKDYWKLLRMVESELTSEEHLLDEAYYIKKEEWGEF